MQLAQKQNLSPIFSRIFEIEIQFWKFSKKKDGPHSWWIFELTDPQKRG